MKKCKKYFKKWQKILNKMILYLKWENINLIYNFREGKECNKYKLKKQNTIIKNRNYLMFNYQNRKSIK
jgi:hypothetical protein